MLDLEQSPDCRCDRWCPPQYRRPPDCQKCGGQSAPRAQLKPEAIWEIEGDPKLTAGHKPDLEEAKGRLECLQKNGPTAEAFTFRDRYPSPGS